MHLNLDGILQSFAGNCGAEPSCTFGSAGIDGALFINDLTDNQGYRKDFSFTTTRNSELLPIHHSYDVPFIVSDTHRNFSFRQDINVLAVRDALADFGHTAGVTLPLPAGFFLTSGSGVFLTQVPEPGVTASLLAGLALLGSQRDESVAGSKAPRLRARRRQLRDESRGVGQPKLARSPHDFEMMRESARPVRGCSEHSMP